MILASNTRCMEESIKRYVKLLLKGMITLTILPDEHEFAHAV
jgi:hypothetical protein